MQDKSLLIIDDDYRIREVTKTTLEIMADWHILTAESGREGRILAKREQPDGILLDIMMPDLDGFATLEQLQSDPLTQEIPILLLTAKARISEDERLKDKQYIGVIHKPFNSLELHIHISQLLNWDI